MGGGGGGSQTASKEPWEPARQPLMDSIKTGQDLERYYQQNPFNALQQQGYQNLFSDVDQFRNQIQPGMMNFATGMMTSNYQRGPRQSQVEAQQRGGMQGMQGMPQAPAQPQPQSPGLLGGVFQAPSQGNYGLLDFAQLNPFTATSGIPQTPVAAPPAAKTQDDLAREEWERLVNSGEAYRGAGA